MSCTFFFFNDTATTEIYTLSLHDALPISLHCRGDHVVDEAVLVRQTGSLEVGLELGLEDLGEDVLECAVVGLQDGVLRSEEHTSELQSRQYLVCRLLLEKKKKTARLYSTS